MTNLELNRRLSSLLDWSEIIELGGALLGKPPEGHPSCRNQAKVPDWTGDWRDCGPLIGEHHISIDSDTVFCVEARCGNGRWVEASMEDISRDEATRRAVVLALIAKLDRP